MSKGKWLVALALSGLFMFSSVTLSEDKKAEPKKDAAPAKPEPAKGGDKAPAKPGDPGAAAEAAAAAAWDAAAKPGPHHKHMEAFVGTFDSTNKFWMSPGAPPMESKGKMVNTMIFGGRYLKSEYNGEFMGEPFQGLGYLAYDNVAKKYTGTWIDNMGSGIYQSTGTCEADGKTIKFTSKHWDPMSNAEETGTDVWKWTDANTYVMSMSGKGPDGKEMKMMEITYTRAK
ncbi:MAG: DUF1579 domain-containing protein [Planctomycetota bacterium]